MLWGNCACRSERHEAWVHAFGIDDAFFSNTGGRNIGHCQFVKCEQESVIKLVDYERFPDPGAPISDPRLCLGPRSLRSPERPHSELCRRHRLHSARPRMSIYPAPRDLAWRDVFPEHGRWPTFNHYFNDRFPVLRSRCSDLRLSLKPKGTGLDNRCQHAEGFSMLPNGGGIP